MARRAGGAKKPEVSGPAREAANDRQNMLVRMRQHKRAETNKNLAAPAGGRARPAPTPLKKRLVAQKGYNTPFQGFPSRPPKKNRGGEKTNKPGPGASYVSSFPVDNWAARQLAENACGVMDSGPQRKLNHSLSMRFRGGARATKGDPQNGLRTADLLLHSGPQHGLNDFRSKHFPCGARAAQVTRRRAGGPLDT